jgi:hypothetical protein
MLRKNQRRFFRKVNALIGLPKRAGCHNLTGLIRGAKLRKKEGIVQ